MKVLMKSCRVFRYNSIKHFSVSEKLQFTYHMIDFYRGISIYCDLATISSRKKTTKAYLRRCGKTDDERPMIQHFCFVAEKCWTIPKSTRAGTKEKGEA